MVLLSRVSEGSVAKFTFVCLWKKNEFAILLHPHDLRIYAPLCTEEANRAKL
jgi:hypothetical protein